MCDVESQPRSFFISGEPLDTCSLSCLSCKMGLIIYHLQVMNVK